MVGQLNTDLFKTSNELYYLRLEKFCWGDGFYSRHPLFPPPDGDVERVRRFLETAKTKPEWRDSEKFKSNDSNTSRDEGG